MHCTRPRRTFDRDVAHRGSLNNGCPMCCMHTDLVGAPRFKFALDEGHGSKPFQHSSRTACFLPAIFEDLLDATISQ